MLDKKILSEDIQNGEQAAFAKEWLERALNKFEADCFEQFKKINIETYQEIDKSCVFMLKLQMKVIEELRQDIFTAITIAQEAKETIKENQK